MNCLLPVRMESSKTLFIKSNNPVKATTSRRKTSAQNPSQPINQTNLPIIEIKLDDNNRKPNDLRVKNSKFIEEIFDHSKADLDEAFNKIKLSFNRLKFEQTSLNIKRLNSNKSICRVSELNKFKRFRDMLDLNNSKLNNFKKIKSNQITVSSSISLNVTSDLVIKSRLPPVYNENELLENKQILPMKPILKIESEKLNNTVTVTWDINLTDGTKHENAFAFIKEYEIYSYKENLDKNQDDSESNRWTLIGNIEPFLPPVKCTLADFMNNCKYYFSIRIIDKNDLKSNFSEPVSIEL